jgi:hypothetical protein
MGSIPFCALSTRAEQSVLPVPSAKADGLPAASPEETIAQMLRVPFEIGPKYVYVCRRLASFLTEYCGNVVYRYSALPTSVTIEPLAGMPAGVRYVLHYAILGSGSAFPALTLGGVVGQRFETETALAVDVRSNPDRGGCPSIQAEPNWLTHPVVQVANGIPATIDARGDAPVRNAVRSISSNIQHAPQCL